MLRPDSRPAITPPHEIRPLVRCIQERLRPVEIWLFGSRARNDHRPESDWDLLAVLPDDAHESLLDPELTWQIARDRPEPVTLLSTRRRDLDAVWNLPNTVGYDLARDGVRLLVG